MSTFLRILPVLQNDAALLTFLANVNLRSRCYNAVACPSVVCLLSVCL